MINMKNKNLLILTNNFPDKYDKYTQEIFVKEQVKLLKDYFKNVYVISPVAYGVDYLRKTTYENYKFDNVYVFFPKYFNFPLFYFYFRNCWSYLGDRETFKLINKMNLNFDLIHAHFTWPSGVIATRLKKKLKTPLVITEHISSGKLKATIFKKDSLYIKTFSESNAIIRVNNKDISLFHKIDIPSNKVFSVPNGYDSNKFSVLNMEDCRIKLELPTDKKIILNVGNLYGEVKGHKYLIEAMNEVIKHRKDVLCIIVGSGILHHKLKNQIESLGLSDYIKLAGGKPYYEIPIWMNACDVFVLPSLNEGNPTVMFECLGCGKPFVGTKVGGIPEIIVSNDYGLLCDPAKPKELAENILLALDKNWNKKKILNYAEQYRWENIAEQIQQIYCHVLRAEVL
ncbi:Glycosyl transferase, group 1 [Methanosarcina mazei TMA]|uniref:glycosyltransferase n=1 Tax=Methanosarcina mazei TaxID=2209 RepID=UPI001C321F1A|nr:glycosyltransferase [Methanosarcina mazei]UWJ21496.1 Glycosyl transferase, group 1 [Methanosarcina mazei TMA]BBL66263.1 glycosyl transferase family 1 [Methanosarcina mazei]